MGEIFAVSNELRRKNVFHQINGRRVLTRRSSIRIPKFNSDLAYLIGVIAGDGSMTRSRRKKEETIML